MIVSMSMEKISIVLYSFLMITRDDDYLKWKEISRNKLLDCRIFDVFNVKRESEKGIRGDFCLLNAPDWVTIVPLLKNPSGEDSFLMVKQFRHGSGEITLEFPAGLVENGENPSDAAARELLEETGYKAGTLIEAGKVNPNPAFMNNSFITFTKA